MRRITCAIVVVLMVASSLAWAESLSDEDALSLWTQHRLGIPAGGVEVKMDGEVVRITHEHSPRVTETFQLLSRSADSDGSLYFELVNLSGLYNLFCVLQIDVGAGLITELISMTMEEDGLTPGTDFTEKTYRL